MSTKRTYTATFSSIRPRKKLVYCYGENCSVCHVMRRTWNVLKRNNQYSFDYEEVDIEKNIEMAKEYDITEMPTILVFDKNDLKGKIVGSRRLATLLAEIETMFS